MTDLHSIEEIHGSRLVLLEFVQQCQTCVVPGQEAGGGRSKRQYRW
jgi:hypothetical protein